MTASRRLIAGIAIVAGAAAAFALQSRSAARRSETAATAITFTDIAGRSQFSYRSNNNNTGRRWFPQPMCGGIAVLDYDNDGKLDLFFTNGAKFPEMRKTDATYDNCLLRNRGDGTFEDVTAKAGVAGRNLGFSFGVAAGDYDNDGSPDLFIANYAANALYHNNGNGTFTDVSAGSGLNTKDANVISIGGAWVDYDNDGLLDLVVTDYTVWTPETDKRCIIEGVEWYCSPRMYTSVVQRLYRNLGNGKFEDVTEKSGFGAYPGKGMGIAIGDVNGDGLVDVFIANDTDRNFLFLNRGDGTFREAALAYGAAYNENGQTVSGMGCDMKDFDNDGRPDVFYNDLMTQLFGLLRNVNGRYFEYASPRLGIDRLSRDFSGWSPGFVDYDNDGWKDLFSANGDIDYIGANSKQHDTMWRNSGGTAFEDVSRTLGRDFLQLGYHRGSAFLDVNGDGFEDIVVTGLNERPRILINSGGNGNHWLLVDATGTKSNRDAIGAKMTLTLGSGRVLYNHVAPSVGFMSTSDKRVHFGLGGEKTIKNLEIRWPSGKVQELEDISADRVVKVKEPL